MNNIKKSCLSKLIHEPILHEPNYLWVNNEAQKGHYQTSKAIF